MIHTPQEQKDIIKNLENLVHKRFSYDNLKLKLCEFFGENDIYTYSIDDDDVVNYDNVMEFCITKPIVGGVFDIYYLPMKNKGPNGEEIYITEVGYIFDM